MRKSHQRRPRRNGQRDRERDILGAKRRKCFQNRGCNILCQLLFRVEENEVLELTLRFGNVEDVGDLDKCSLVEVVGMKF